jgi:hypothetical protein
MRPEKRVRNDIHAGVVAGGLDPRACTFEYDDDWARVTHRPSASYLELKGNIARFEATPVIGDRIPLPLAPFSWIVLEAKVRDWATEVKLDADTPDRWAEIQREGEILTGARYIDVENTPFTLDEQAQIAEQLEQIKRSAQATYGLSDERMLELSAKLDEIKDASGRMGRKDWVLLFGGAMLGLILTDLLPPSAAQNILITVLHGLEHLFVGGGGPHLLPPMLA